MLRKYYLELLLILSVLLLIGQLTWPSIGRWWQRPVPGAIGIETFSRGNGLADWFVIYLPEEYDNVDKDWPLILFLHGSGERGRDPSMLRGSGPLAMVQRIMPLPAIVVAPQCLPENSWQPAAVAEFIRHVNSVHGVDETKIYLVGYSMGSYGTWATAAAYPELFAAIVPISGGGNPDHAELIARIPVWAFHGDKDDVVSLTASEQMIDALRAAGGTPKLTILPNAGHGICGEVCARSDLWDWLLEQRRETASVDVQESAIPSVQ
jgi:predicted peptidase